MKTALPYLIIAFILWAAGGCKFWKGEKTRESITLLGSVEAKWVEVDENEMGVENGTMGKAAQKILDARIQQSRRFRLDKAKGGAVLNLFISVMPGNMGLEAGAGATPAGIGPEKEAGSDKPRSFEAIHVLKYKGEEGWPLSTAIVVKAGSTAELKNAASFEEVIHELVDSMEKQVDLLKKYLLQIKLT